MGVAPRIRLAARGRRRDAAVVVLAAAIIGLPALLARDGFMYDYTNHLWLVFVQGRAIALHGLPTYFLNAPGAGGGVQSIFRVLRRHAL